MGEAGWRAGGGVLGPEPSLFSGAVCWLLLGQDPRPGEGEGLTQGLLHTHLVTTEQWGPWLTAETNWDLGGGPLAGSGTNMGTLVSPSK